MLFQIQAFCVSLDKTMLVSHAIGERDQLLPVIKHKFAAGPQICTEVLLTCLEFLMLLPYACISVGCRESILHDW